MSAHDDEFPAEGMHSPECRLSPGDVPAQPDPLVKLMAERFLCWPLPEDFSPDAGISFAPVVNEGTEREWRHKPTGTNLFSADQAAAMVAHMLEGLPIVSLADLKLGPAEIALSPAEEDSAFPSVRIELTSAEANLLDLMADAGVLGSSRDEVVLYFLKRGLDDLMRSGVLKLGGEA